MPLEQQNQTCTTTTTTKKKQIITQQHHTTNCKLKITNYLKASKMMMTTLSTAGFVQHWEPSPPLPAGGDEQGEAEASEQALKADSSVRVRRNPRVKRKMATAWSAKIAMSRHINEAFMEPSSIAGRMEGGDGGR